MLNRGVNNYVVTFVLEDISPIQSPERGVLIFNTMEKKDRKIGEFRYHNTIVRTQYNSKIRVFQSLYRSPPLGNQYAVATQQRSLMVQKYRRL